MAEQTFDRVRVCINDGGTVKYYCAYVGTDSVPYVAHVGVGGGSVDNVGTTSILGNAVLGVMILGNGGE